MTETPTGRQQDSPQQFCRDFAALLDERGVSVREAAERSNWSKSAIGNARTGPKLPSLDLVSAVLGSVGLDEDAVQDWTLRHAALSMAQTPDVAPSAAVEGQSADARRPGGRIALLLLAAVLLGGLASGGIIYLVMRPDPASPVAATVAVVTVQNKIALGAEDLVEDGSPSYLSGEPIAFCGSRGCKIEGTEIVSGALLPATCVRRGETMWNYNLDSPAAQNPYRAESDLWYRVSWPDGRAGYLSEVYLEPASRGGLSLPIC